MNLDIIEKEIEEKTRKRSEIMAERRHAGGDFTYP